MLPVGGAFHSSLMNAAKIELEHAINETKFTNPICPIYQNVNGLPFSNINEIKQNLILQLTHPVCWSQSINKMIDNGVKEFIEVGPGKVLHGLLRKINSDYECISLEINDEK